MSPYRWQISLFLLLGILATLAEALGATLMIPLLQGRTPLTTSGDIFRLINLLVDIFPVEDRSIAIAGLILTAVFSKAILSYGYTILASWVKNTVFKRLQTGLFERLLYASPEYLDAQQAGHLLHTFTVSAEQTSLAVQIAMWLCLNICTILIFSILLMAIAWQLTLALVLTLLVLAYLVRLATHRVGRTSHTDLQIKSGLSQRIKECVLGLRTIHIFGMEDFENQQFIQAAEQSYRLSLKREKLISLAHPLTEGLAAIVMITLVVLAQRAEFALSVLVTMAFMLLRLQPQIQNANTNIAHIIAQQSVVQSVLQLLNSKDDPNRIVGGRCLKKLEKGISFKQVAFRYTNGNREALSAIDFEIGKGRTTALVGPSGAGKSTIINLLCRFYEPGSGQILVDGQPLNEFDLVLWRKRIALVSQDVHLFSGTIRENIAYSKFGADDTEIISAAMRAHAHEFIQQLPQGYDTTIGDAGKLLSGGQRQRLSLARAFLRDPEILILDEATNALDNLSETYIQASIEELGRDRTVVVVAHRLSTIENADHIVVIDHGQAVEQGRFEDLLAANGLFASLYHSKHNML